MYKEKQIRKEKVVALSGGSKCTKKKNQQKQRISYKHVTN
jgi:hypothetical protein